MGTSAEKAKSGSHPLLGALQTTRPPRLILYTLAGLPNPVPELASGVLGSVLHPPPLNPQAKE